MTSGNDGREGDTLRRPSLRVFSFHKLSALEGVVHGFSMREHSGQETNGLNMSFKTANANDHVVQNRRRFFQALGIPLEHAVFMQQSHRDGVAVITRPDAGKGATSPESAIPGTDAMITCERGVSLAALAADCAVVTLCDRAGGAAGIVHAGWRGTVLGIVEKAVCRMRAEMGCRPGDIFAGIGPSIGPCCYEVGSDVVEAAKAGRGAEAISTRNGKLYLDLRRANRQQLLAQGIPVENIEVADVCTCCAHDRFFSYRREGAAGGRFCGVIGLTR